MKTALIAVLITVVSVTAALAADNSGSPQGTERNIEQKRAEILQHIAQRIALSQEEITCVKTAQSHDEFRTCRDKYRPVKLQDDRLAKSR